jgi:3-dehydroquinate synthase
LVFKDSVPASLHVELRDKTYPIHFVEEAAHAIATTIREFAAAGRTGALLMDKAVQAVLPAPVTEALQAMPRLVLPGGERTKSLEHFGSVLDFMAEHKLDRNAVLWVLGGGVMGDLGGFAAACYLRGIDCIQVPTTLLAMVDSSVGGKTGINLAAGKNLVGAFHHPCMVIIAPEFLATLPAREFAAGMAEVLKYGLLGDAGLFARLEKSPVDAKSPDLPAIIRRCCEIKAGFVRADERETAAMNGRALLNLGHTFGHALEQVTGYKVYLHGEAVAVGLAAAARLSQKLGLIQPADVMRVEQAIAAHTLPIRLREPLPLASLVASMLHDKKVRAGRLRFIALNRLCEAATRADVDPGLVETVWRELGAD